MLIHFIEKLDGQENIIMTIVTEFFPSYKKDGILFLRKVNRDDESENMKLTQYRIVEIHDSITEYSSDKFKESKISMSMEIYLKLEP